jgi:hypothetical protein
MCQHRYPYCGHSVLVGRGTRDWRERDYVLRCFGTAVGAARRRYREYAEKGIAAGRLLEFTGGGLIRRTWGLGKGKGAGSVGDSAERG